MYMSRISIPFEDVPKLASDVREGHLLVTKGLQPDEPRYLYRIEDTVPVCILVQSVKKPDWSKLPEKYSVQSKSFNLQFNYGDRFLFRLRANCCRCVDGKRLGIGGEDRQLAWLDDRATFCGFHVLSARARDEGMYNSPERRDLKFRSVVFDGVLVVNDPTLFKDVLEKGIGHGKAFGFGMISLTQ